MPKQQPSCSRCKSHAINEGCHGRIPGFRSDLCDVCYWRNIAESSIARLRGLKEDACNAMLRCDYVCPPPPFNVPEKKPRGAKRLSKA
jgi:hypothetical protein